MLAQKAPGTDEQPSLNLLGTFTLTTADGRPVVIKSKKNKALLACLALSPDCASTRDRLATLLWGSHGEEQARASVRQSLVMLRKELGSLSDAILANEGETLRLRPSSIAVDALELLAHESQRDVLELRRLAQRISPEPLSDYRVQEEDFDEWLRHERARLNAASTRLLERLCEMEAGPMRVEAARRLLLLDPLRESSHRILMRAYLAQGDKSLALKQFDECRALLRRELQVDPSEETLLLRQEIMEGRASATPAAAQSVEPERKPDPKLPGRPSIAVLPFANIYSEESQQYFSDGITEELITSLSRFRHLFVIARPSSFHYRDQTMTPGEIGRKLGVKFLLYGTMGRLSGRIRVTAQLIEAETETTVWSEKFDRAAGDILEVIDELAGIIVASTVGRIDQQILRQVRRKPTESLAAYELFLRGKALMHSPKREDKLAARKLFEDAIAVDEDFVQARAQLAYTYLYEFFGDESEVALDRAARIAAEVLEIDEQEAWGHLVLGLTHLYRRRFDLALKHCERAVQLNPSDPSITAKLGIVMADLGRGPEAIDIIRRAMRLNPVNADGYSDYLALAYMSAKRFEEATSVLEGAPEDAFYYYAWLVICYVQTGRLADARKCAARIIELSPDFTLTRIRTKEPLRDPNDLALWIDSLRAAGVPE